MKNKGFTIVELISAFAITSLIVVLLINLVVVIKNIYNKSNTRTELYIIQGNLSNAINEKLGLDNLKSITKCNDEEFCYNFELKDEKNIKLTVTDKIIKFGNQTFKLSKNSEVINPKIATYKVNNTEEKKDSFLYISIPIKNKVYLEENFGVNIVYSYNSNSYFFDVDNLEDLD